MVMPGTAMAIAAPAGMIFRRGSATARAEINKPMMIKILCIRMKDAYCYLSLSAFGGNNSSN